MNARFCGANCWGATMENERPSIRWMIRRDMPDILAIESAVFHWDAWTEEDFMVCLRQRNCIGMVAEIDDRVVGYMIYELHRDWLHLVNFAVDPKLHRQRIGTAMVDRLKSKLNHHQRHTIAMVVSENNLPMHLFLRANGFTATNVLRDYYDSGVTTDGYEFRYATDTATARTPSPRKGSLYTGGE